MEVLCSSDSFLFTFMNCRIVSVVKKLFPICFFALHSRKSWDFHWNRRNRDSLPSGFPVRNSLLSSLAREQKRHLRSLAKQKKQRTETRSSLARETEETESGTESPPTRASVRNSSYLTQKATHRSSPVPTKQSPVAHVRVDQPKIGLCVGLRSF